jgi:hypothetical protein
VRVEYIDLGGVLVLDLWVTLRRSYVHADMGEVLG